MLPLRLCHIGLVPPPAACAGNDCIDHDHADPSAVLFRARSQHCRRVRRVQLGGLIKSKPPEPTTVILWANTRIKANASKLLGMSEFNLQNRAADYLTISTI